MEWAGWITLLVWAYTEAGVTGASLVAVIQLVPSAAFAPVLSMRAERLPRGIALALGYLAQGVTFLACGIALIAGAGFGVVAALAALTSIAVSVTRPIHHAFLPEASRTPDELTAGNALSGSLEAVAIVIGPLASSGLILLWGPGGVLLALSTLGFASAALVARLRTGPGRQAGTTEHAAKPRIGDVVRDPTSRVLTTLVAGEFALIGMLDILFVVLALDVLDMSEGGPGLLNAMIGIGGLAGAGAALTLVGRQRLVPALALGGLAAGVPIALSGLTSGVVAAALLIAVAGCGKVVFDVAARTLLQRLLPQRLLTTVFGVQESVMDIGLGVGSLAAPVLVATLGPRGAFVAAGLFLPLLVLALVVPLRRLDRRASVPLDVLALLRGVPFLSPLAPGTLDRLARDAAQLTVAEGRAVISEGDVGDRFFVLEAGSVEVTIGGAVVRRIDAGGWFGELALLRAVPRTATVTALEPLVLRSVERATFLAVVAGVGPAVEAVDDHARRHYR